LLCCDSAAPDDAMTQRLSVASVGSLSSASSSGFTIASPTATTLKTDSFAIVCHTSRGSNLPSGISTTLPPVKSWWNVSQCAAACINGGAASAVMPFSGSRCASSSGPLT